MTLPLLAYNLRQKKVSEDQMKEILSSPKSKALSSELIEATMDVSDDSKTFSLTLEELNVIQGLDPYRRL